MKDIQDLLDAMHRELDGVEAPSPTRGVFKRARRRRARNTAAVGVLSIAVIAGVVLPLKAMAPLGDRDKNVGPVGPAGPSDVILTTAYFDESRQIVTYSLDGTQRRLTNNEGQNGTPAWSPDGTRVAYVTGDRANDEPDTLAVMDVATGQVTQLPSGPGNPDGPAWSPDGSQIVFSKNRTGHGELFLIDADGSHLRQLTTNDVGGDYDPAWSPDGRTIVFGRNSGGRSDIWQVDVSSEQVSQLTFYGRGDSGPTGPEFSPDGSRIAFTNGRPDAVATRGLPWTADLFVVNADGSDARKVTPNSFWEGALDWVSDDSVLALPMDLNLDPDEWDQPQEVFPSIVNVDTGWVHPLGFHMSIQRPVTVDWNPQVPYVAPATPEPVIEERPAEPADTLAFSCGSEGDPTVVETSVVSMQGDGILRWEVLGTTSAGSLLLFEARHDGGLPDDRAPASGFPIQAGSGVVGEPGGGFKPGNYWVQCGFQGDPGLPQSGVFDPQPDPSRAVPVELVSGPSPVATPSATADRATVPDVTGLSKSEAMTLLNNAGLALGELSSLPSGAVQPGAVVAQFPAAGAKVAPGTTVDIKVAVTK